MAGARPQASAAMMDVVVTGAGPAGAIAAGLLARAGLAVTMIDPRPEGFRI
ncbi:FAD-dependent monooxygenase, partial [Nannocystis sp. RBIL2]|uniref:FAD-dependent monooxygenase n=1 Tax=Nannocystis sp. RBIL2 TaxID=2996788 RepID=UPI0032099A23